jgi:dihydroxy-acid dehydratase
VRERSLDLLVEDDELGRRRAGMSKDTHPEPSSFRGYDWLYNNFVTQANEGCDFAFLRRDAARKIS